MLKITLYQRFFYWSSTHPIFYILFRGGELNKVRGVSVKNLKRGIIGRLFITLSKGFNYFASPSFQDKLNFIIYLELAKMKNFSRLKNR